MEGVVALVASLVSLAQEAIYKAKIIKKKKKAPEHWPGQLKNPALTLER